MVEKKKSKKTSVGAVTPNPVGQVLPEDLLGARIKEVRATLGLTHDGLSDLTKVVDQERRGISRTSIRGYELGTYKPGARELRILSLALNKSPDWLLFGGSYTDGATNRKVNANAVERPRWFDIAMPLLCYSQLKPSEGRQIRELVETLYRLQSGEVRFRSMKSFVEDFVDTIQDAARDLQERGDVGVDSVKKVLIATSAEMLKKHGKEEADLLMALIDPFVDSVSKIASREKKPSV
jgi:transcriptional regulator with XRE-family HTH domain